MRNLSAKEKAGSIPQGVSSNYARPKSLALRCAQLLLRNARAPSPAAAFPFLLARRRQRRRVQARAKFGERRPRGFGFCCHGPRPVIENPSAARQPPRTQRILLRRESTVYLIR
ncbi:hypothetical protein MTO96_015275 [Rhipicephalus appendiculatus]